MHIFVCFWNFLGMVVAYDYDCGGGVFFGGHSCLVDSFCGGFMVWWVDCLTPIHLEDFANLDELKTVSRLCGELYCANRVGHVSSEE